MLSKSLHDIHVITTVLSVLSVFFAIMKELQKQNQNQDDEIVETGLCPPGEGRTF